MKKNILQIIVLIVFIITFIIDFFFNKELEPLINIIYSLSIILLVYIGNIDRTKEEKKDFKVIFILYIALIVSLTFNKSSHYYEEMYNLIPFNTILNIRGNTWLLKTLIFNFFLYMPFAIILPKMNNNLKYLKNYVITIIFISICVKGLGYILHYTVLDIDDIILNVLGSISIFMLLKNKRINYFINNILLKVKIKKITKNIIYIMVYILFIGISVIKLCRGIGIIYQYYYRDFSHLVCYQNQKTFLAIKENEKYYSKCDYKDSYIIAGNIKYSVSDYLKSWQYRESDDIKLHIIKEKIIDNIKVIKKENTIKKIYSYSDYKKVYMVDIEYISLTKDGILYQIENEQEEDINFNSLVKLYSLNHCYDFSYVLYKGDYFNILHLFFNDNSMYEFIIPKDYIVDKNVMKLYEYAKNNKD